MPPKAAEICGEACPIYKVCSGVNARGHMATSVNLLQRKVVTVQQLQAEGMSVAETDALEQCKKLRAEQACIPPSATR